MILSGVSLSMKLKIKYLLFESHLTTCLYGYTFDNSFIILSCFVPFVVFLVFLTSLDKILNPVNTQILIQKQKKEEDNTRTIDVTFEVSHQENTTTYHVYDKLDPIHGPDSPVNNLVMGLRAAEVRKEEVILPVSGRLVFCTVLKLPNTARRVTSGIFDQLYIACRPSFKYNPRYRVITGGRDVQFSEIRSGVSYA